MLMENIKEHENSEINTDELVVILLTTRLSDKDTLTTIGFREFYKFFNWIQASKYKLRDLLDESTLKYILDVYSIQIYKLLSSSRKAYLLKKIKEWDKNGIKVITFLNKKYPQTLKNKLHSPTVLFAYGNTNYLNEKHISIQGEDYPDKQSENQLKINKQLMDLHDPNISEDDKNYIISIIENPNKSLKTLDFVNLYNVIIFYCFFDH